jgi:hypothetical protein
MEAALSSSTALDQKFVCGSESVLVFVFAVLEERLAKPNVVVECPLMWAIRAYLPECGEGEGATWRRRGVGLGAEAASGDQGAAQPEVRGGTVEVQRMSTEPCSVDKRDRRTRLAKAGRTVGRD